MNNLTTIQNNLLINNDSSYLCFGLDNNKYAVNIQDVVEIMKLPKLEYVHNYFNSVAGILNYNGFTLNVVDLRFCLGLEVKQYTVSNHLIIVKTDEMIFGIIIDKPYDVISLRLECAENITCSSPDKSIIDGIYINGQESISVINLDKVEEHIKNDSRDEKFNVPNLFPNDEKSEVIFEKRRNMLQLKENTEISKNIFSQSEYITFSLNDNIYCINLDYTKEFVKNTVITDIPCNLDYIEGIISFRGNFVTIINLGSFINEDVKVDKEHNNLIILDFADYNIGIAVDEIYKIENIPEDIIQTKNGEENDYIFGEAIINDKIFYIIDIKNVMADERLFIEQN